MSAQADHTKFLRINPVDMALIVVIGERIRNLLTAHAKLLHDKGKPIPHEIQHVTDPMLTQMDLAIVHLAIPLDLMRMQYASEFDLIEDYLTIAQHINRPLLFFPASVKLRFAQASRSH